MEPNWESLNNVTIFKEAKPFTVPNHDVILYPCPVSQKQSKKDLTEWIQSEDDSISIGLAHGNLKIEGFTNDTNFPIAPERADLSGLDYLALGEWHSLSEHKSSDGTIRTIYPGTPETTKFGEKNSGKSVIVEIDRPKSQPSVTAVDVGTLFWEKKDVEIHSRDEAKNLYLELRNIEDPQNKVISLNLKGVTDQDTISYLESFHQHFFNKFMQFNLKKDELYLKPNLLELKALLPEGALVNQTFEALMALMKTQPKIQEYSDIPPLRANEIFRELHNQNQIEGLSTPEVLNRALLIFYQMVREVSP